MNMKRIALMVMFAISLTGLLTYAATGRCAICPSISCHTSGNCGHNCACLKGPGEVTGICVSIDGLEGP